MQLEMRFFRYGGLHNVLLMEPLSFDKEVPFQRTW